MLNSIQGRIALGFGPFIVLGLGVFLASYVVIEQQKNDSLLVNLARRQSTLVQSVTADTLSYARHVEQGNARAARSTAESIHDSMRAFDMTLAALRNGGNAPMNLEMTEVRSVPAAETEEIGESFLEIQRLWQPFKRQVERALSDTTVNQAALDAVLDGDEPIFEKVDESVALLQARGEMKSSGMYVVQAISVALGMMFVIIGLVTIRKSVIKPISILAEAAEKMSTGDLDVTVPGSGATEVVDLAGSFNRMRMSMIATLSSTGGQDDLDDL